MNFFNGWFNKRRATGARRCGWLIVCALILVITVTCPGHATPVFDGGHQIGTIESHFYEPWYAFSLGPGKFPIGHTNRISGDVAGGARFDAVFQFTCCSDDLILRPDLEFRWVQIVYTSNPMGNVSRGMGPTTGYVDPWTPPSAAAPTGYEDNQPFYWTDNELANIAIGGGGLPNALLFQDSSRRSFSDTGITWRAELNLVCTWDDNLIHPLGYYEWGWIMPDGMLSDPDKLISLNPSTAVWKNGASPGLPKLELPTEFGAFGWSLTNESCCVPVPEPGTLLLLGSGLATLAIGQFRKRLF